MDLPIKIVIGGLGVRGYEVYASYAKRNPDKMQVTAIAAQCGFEDSSYFARSFRQLYGCGPTEFRRRTLRAGQ